MEIAIAIFAISVISMIVLAIAGNLSRKLSKVQFPLYVIPLIVGAILFLLIGVADINDVLSAFGANTSVNPLKILGLFLAMSILSIYLDEVGFFSFLASWALSKFNKGQKSLFSSLLVLVSFLTIFTSNDIVILTFTPFICGFCHRAKISPIPYLIMEFVMANTFSMLFVIGNPTNIYLASYAGLGFFEYLSYSYLASILSGVGVSILLYFIFRKSLSQPISADGEISKIVDRFSLAVSLSCLGIGIILMAISSYVGLEMYIVSIALFLVLLIVELFHSIKTPSTLSLLKKTFRRVPYQVIPLLISMFVMVLGLESSGVSSKLGDFLSQVDPIIAYGVSSSIFDNLINNIPMSVLFASVSTTSSAPIKAVMASVIGSNLGAFITPIGALAGLMFLSLVKKEGVKLSFLDFSKYGILCFVVALPLALLGLWLIM